ncbi:MAG: RNA polymerase sigma factor [Verrucomicrobiota bacterium]|nr:RNA polymerase sigma factor [Verrucomicrobiota bacterium]
MNEAGQPEESDARLIKRMQGGDLSAFDMLFDRYRRGMLAYVDGLVHDRGLAEDIVQDCFVRMARRLDSIDPGKSLYGWLFRVARNRAIDILRHRKFEVMPGDEYFRDSDGQRAADNRPGPAGPMMEAEMQAAVRRALQQLPEKDRDLLLLRFYGDLTFEQAARALRRPLGTVLWQSQRILKRLKGFLKAENGL